MWHYYFTLYIIKYVNIYLIQMSKSFVLHKTLIYSGMKYIRLLNLVTLVTSGVSLLCLKIFSSLFSYCLYQNCKYVILLKTLPINGNVYFPEKWITGTLVHMCDDFRLKQQICFFKACLNFNYNGYWICLMLM